MSEDMSSSMNEIQLDPHMQCLELAEKIISSINDQDLVQRYFQFKNNLFATRPPQMTSPTLTDDFQHMNTDQAFALYQSLSQENEQLREEISQLSSQSPDFSKDPENESIAAQLRELQKQIFPGHVHKSIGTAVDELKHLKNIVDSKLQSLSVITEGLRKENQQLKANYSETSKNLRAKVEAAKEKEQNELHEIEEQQRSLANEVKKAQQEYDQLYQQLQAAQAENEQYRQQYTEAQDRFEQIKNETSEKKLQIDQLESQSEQFYEEIKALQTQLTVKNKELSTLQTLQKFGVEVEDEYEIADEIQILTKKAESLAAENAQMAFELKRLEKRQKASSFLDTSEAISLDEDELAAQILKSKW